MKTLNTDSIRAITTEELQLIGGSGDGIIGPNGCWPMPPSESPSPFGLPLPWPYPLPTDPFFGE